MSENTDPRKVILLVDDDPVFLSTTNLLLKNDYKIFTVKSGEEALEFLNKNQIIPDIILLDILMPVMDGWAVFDRIQDIAALKHTPIIFYTSLEEASAKEKAYELGAFDYIVKPCEQIALLSRISEALKKAELKKQHYGIS